jgi:hypothetical protein
MAREKEYQKAAHEYINSDAVKPENMYLAYGDFINGAKWADEHPQSPWISVEERLPEKINKFMSEPVLCRYTRGNKEYFHVSQYDFAFDEWQISNVTHWMPIPSLKRDEEDIDDPRLTEKQKKELGYK